MARVMRLALCVGAGVLTAYVYLLAGALVLFVAALVCFAAGIEDPSTIVLTVGLVGGALVGGFIGMEDGLRREELREQQRRWPWHGGGARIPTACIALAIGGALLAGEAAAFTFDPIPPGIARFTGEVIRHRDGDTSVLEVPGAAGPVAIRHKAWASPEATYRKKKGQRRGDEAKATLGELAPPGSAMTCALSGEANGDRLVAWCSGELAGDLGRAMILAGMARRCTAHDEDGRYAGLQRIEDASLALAGYCDPPKPRRKARKGRPAGPAKEVRHG